MNESEPRQIDKLFRAMDKHNASDLHLKAGSPPIYRIIKVPQRMKMEPLTGEQIQKLVFEIMPESIRNEFNEIGSVDFAYSIPGVGRFRVNVFLQRGSPSMAARRVQFDIPTLEELHLPKALEVIPKMEAGLVLVAGVTGSGKSTTLAALINIINQTKRCHIVTIEDPIEYLYRDAKAFVNQREVGIDVDSFNTALRYVVRQDPDVILIGELRDMESMETAIIAAETGHLVFATLHAASAAQSIGRILDYFPKERHSQIRQLLHFNLKCVMVQKLIKGAHEHIPLVPSLELMFVNPTIRKLIREDEDEKIPDVIHGGTHEGMQDMNQSLVSLIHQGLITEQEGLDGSPNPEALKMNLKGIYLGSDKGTLTG